jgi:uncharacterized protein YndB with AHSA1/START domain
MTAPELRLTRVVNGSIEEVFNAWTDPAILSKWWGPGDYTTPEVQLDVRPGGAYRLVMQSPEGQSMAVTGTYFDVEPPHRLVFTWRWEAGGPPDATESVVTVELSPLGDQTELVLTHAGFPDAATAAPYSDGWEAALPKLEALFA